VPAAASEDAVSPADAYITITISRGDRWLIRRASGLTPSAGRGRLADEEHPDLLGLV
jgi:hypothetical protein